MALSDEDFQKMAQDAGIVPAASSALSDADFQKMAQDAGLTQPPGFVSRLGTSLVNDANDVVKQSNTPTAFANTPISGIMDATKNAATALSIPGRVVGDVVGQAAKSVGNYMPQTRDAVDKWGNDLYQKAINTPLPSWASGPVQAVIGAYNSTDPSTKAQLNELAQDAGNTLNAGVLKDVALNPLADTTGKAVSSAANGLNEALGSTIVPSSADVKAAAQASYKAADKAGGMLTPEAADKWRNNIINMPTDDAETESMFGQDPMADLAGKAQANLGQPMSLQTAQNMYKRLNGMISNEVGTGGLSAYGKQLLDIKNGLKNLITNPAAEDVTGGTEGFDAFNQANKDWAVHSQMDDIEQILKRARNSDNPASVMKSGAGTIANNDSWLNSFPENIQNKIMAASKTSPLMTAAAAAPPVILGAAGSLLGPLGTLAGGAIGTAADLGFGASSFGKGIVASMRENQLNKILEDIAANSSIGVQKTTAVDNLLSKLANQKPGT